MGLRPVAIPYGGDLHIWRSDEKSNPHAISDVARRVQALCPPWTSHPSWRNRTGTICQYLSVYWFSGPGGQPTMPIYSKLAGSMGFQPMIPFGILVLQTSALEHSANSRKTMAERLRVKRVIPEDVRVSNPLHYRPARDP